MDEYDISFGDCSSIVDLEVAGVRNEEFHSLASVLVKCDLNMKSNLYIYLERKTSFRNTNSGSPSLVYNLLSKYLK